MTGRIPVLLLTLALTACGGDEHQDLKQWMAEASQGMRGRVQPIPEIKPFPVVSYDAGDLPEPFSPSKAMPEKRASTGGVQPDFDRPREPLEAYPLEALRMVGVVRKNKALYALIQVDNMVHQVRTGNHLGQDFGVIASITEAQVNVKELVQDPSGHTTDWVERLATLQLQEGTQPQKEAKK
ncbi:MAG: pilus assembly protein PilP [Rhodocyclaceae bacterium]|nr:pilus assembly protein PilP [Rhodocyclaceae bacterium]MBK7815880.1 pilus assembly protein PilP [Rhodocyclaceae bacterium]